MDLCFTFPQISLKIANVYKELSAHEFSRLGHTLKHKQVLTFGGETTLTL